MNAAAHPRILCVDDDSDMLDWMKLMLSSRGYQVSIADNGNEALQALDKAKPDVILLDVNMPDLNGYEVCSRLQEREETAYIPVIMVTTLGGDQDKVRALKAGAADYLVKPIDEKVLFSKVESHLATQKRWSALKTAQSARWDARLRPSEFGRFKELLAQRAKLAAEARATLSRLAPADIYGQATVLGLESRMIAEAMAEFLGFPYARQFNAQDVKLGVLPTPFCRSNHIVPVAGDGGALTFVLSNPFDWEVQEAIKRTLDRSQPPTLILTEPETVDHLLNPAATKKKVEIAKIEARLREEYAPEEPEEEIKESADEESAPIIQLVNNLVDTAYAQRASDIHIEPTEEEVVIRYRIDGDLQIVKRLKPARLCQPIAARIKIMSNLDISERRLPQDGRIKFKQYSSSGKDFDLRVATAPVNHGEKVVIRILDKEKSVLPLTDLGFSQRNLELYRERIANPYGMILHVGPTGSGKSMTLYAALNEIKDPSLNIQTAEDPIEYTLPGINQLQVHKEIGLTFQRALRSFLRLDPDVILVGEIRDHETAQMAIEASLTGHLLLSTLHTNDAASTVTRFIEMGVEPYLVSSSLLVICAQRLLRRLCKECREPYAPDAAQRRFVGASEKGEVTLYKARGCGSCSQTGYRGRIGIHEVLAPNDEFRMAVNRKGVTGEQLKRMAVEKMGMITLFWDAMDKVRAGLCSVADALANVRQDEFDSRPRAVNAGAP